MSNIIEITDFNAPELDVYARISEIQLLNRAEPEKGIFIAESPKVIERALDSGCQPISFLVEHKHVEGEAKELIRRCGDIPVYTAEFDVLTQLTGFKLTRGMLCAMRRPAHCTEHSSCQLESSQLRQHIKFCRINRDVSTTTDQFFCLTLNMFMFHQKRNRLAPGIQSSLNNLRALRNKDPLLRFCPVQKLYLRDPGIYIQLRSVEICDFYDI